MSYPFTPADARALDAALERLLRSAGIQEGRYPDLFSQLYNATTESMTIYVNSATGTDASDGRFADQPMRTIMAAINRVPKRIRHNVIIEVAPGTYDAFTIQGFLFESLNDGTGCGIFIKGDVVATTDIATNLATGTVTGGTTGNAAAGAWTVIQDSTKSWVVDSLKGKMLRYAVAGVTTIVSIVSNDATSVSIAAQSAPPVNGTAYLIGDGGAVITGAGIQVPGSIQTLTVASGTPTKAWITVFDNIQPSRVTAIRIEGMKVVPVSPQAADSAIILNTNGGSSVSLGRVQVGTMAAGTPISLFGNGTVNFTSVSLTPPNATNGIQAGGSAISNISPTLTTNGVVIGTSSGTGFSLGSSHAQGVSLLNISCETAIGVNIFGFCQLQMAGVNKFYTGSSQAIRARTASGAMGGAFFWLNSGAHLECVGRSNAIEVVGAHHFSFEGTLAVSASAGGVVAGTGARVRVSATSTISASGTELQVDSTNYTLAQMRGATPKHVKDSNYFTVIYE